MAISCSSRNQEAKGRKETFSTRVKRTILTLVSRTFLKLGSRNGNRRETQGTKRRLRARATNKETSHSSLSLSIRSKRKVSIYFHPLYRLLSELLHARFSASLSNVPDCFSNLPYTEFHADSKSFVSLCFFFPALVSSHDFLCPFFLFSCSACRNQQRLIFLASRTAPFDCSAFRCCENVSRFQPTGFQVWETRNWTANVSFRELDTLLQQRCWNLFSSF